MRAGLLILSILFFNGCASREVVSNSDRQSKSCLGDNTKPMYGYDANHIVNHCDQVFLDSIDSKTNGHRDQAIYGILDLGYSVLEKDPQTAIKRFNQAWLLDRNEASTYNAFKDWEMQMGNTERADQFRDKARMLK